MNTKTTTISADEVAKAGAPIETSIAVKGVTGTTATTSDLTPDPAELVAPGQMVAVESSQIAAIGHLGDVLTVEFKNGSVYDYKNVPAELHAELMSAESVGKFFNANIKGNPGAYPWVKVK